MAPTWDAVPVHRVRLTAEDVEGDFRRIVGGLLRHDPLRGMNVWGQTSDPVMLVWSPRILEFLEVLESIMSYPPARGVCREVGYRSGFDGARAAPSALGFDPSRKVEILLAMPRVLAGAGWGVSELEFDEEGQHVRWSFPKGTAVGVAAVRPKVRTAPACAFFEGFGAGWVKGSVDLQLEFVEGKCVGTGDRSCDFESQPLR